MPVTAPVSLTKVKAEFGGVANNLKAYNRGGARVPNIAANNAIATDPNALRLSQFLNATNVVASVQISDQFITDQAEEGSFRTLTAGYRLDPDGKAYTVEGSVGDFPIVGEWGTGVNGSDYQVRAIYSAGANPTSGPALGTWHSLGQQRIWTLTSSTTFNHEIESYLSVSIRRVSDSVILDTITLYLNVRRGAPL